MGRQTKNRVGEANTTNYGLTMKIVSYKSSDNITVEFPNLGIIKENIQYSSFKSGNIKAPMLFEIEGDITTCTNPNLNFSFLIDTDDLPKIYGVMWRQHKGYVYNTKKGLLHKIIMSSLGQNEEIDHINRIRTDNRKENLRLCNSSQNNINKHKDIRNKSGYKGVSWAKNSNKWRAGIGYNYKYIKLGYFDNIHEAARAYNQKAKELFGEFAYLNTIQEEAQNV
jgi:hypothetical protein